MLILRDDRYDVPWWERGNFSAIPPPPGLTSNYVNPPSKAVWGTVTTSVCLTVATLLVAMRMYTKFKVLKNIGWDDYTTFLAWLGLIGLAIVCLEEDRHGNGRHLWDITGNQYTAYAKLNYISDILYNPVIFFTKASLLILYLRVFNPVRRTLIILHIVLWANFIFYTGASFFEAFQCKPVQKAWLPLWPGHCFNQKMGQTSSAIINTCSDLIILVVPIANVWRLQLHKKSKAGILTIFSFGIFACIVSIARVVLYAERWPTVEGTTDGTWIFYPIELISVAEVTCGIICGCLPALPAFLKHISGLQVKIKPTSWWSTTRQPITDAERARGGSTVLPPTPTVVSKSPAYNHVNFTSIAANGKTDRKGSAYHPWEELDELEYVAGDDKRQIRSA
ncbi:hypothetical protein BDR22DRAFT_894428 [Usnea florida]